VAHPAASSTQDFSEASDDALSREHAEIDAARADVAAGRVIPDEDVDEWLERWARGARPYPIDVTGPSQ
jgi:predicted transcriptional regulator